MSTPDPSTPPKAMPNDRLSPIPPAITATRWRAIVVGGIVLALALAFVVLKPAADKQETPSVASADPVTPGAAEQPVAGVADSVATPPVSPAATTEPDPVAIMRANMPRPKTGGISINEFLNGPWVGEIEERPVTADDRWRALFVWHRTAGDDANIIVHATHADAMQTFTNLFGDGDNPLPYNRATHHFDLELPAGDTDAPRTFRCVMRPSLVVCGRVAPGDRVLVTLQQRAETAAAATEQLDTMMFGIASVAMKKNARSVLGTLGYLRVLKLQDYKPLQESP